MSEAESGDDEAAAGREIWIEKYRPQRLSEINGQGDTVERLRSYVDREDLPHLLFAGPAGVGKCVTGETPVLTGRGVERIETVVGDVEGFDDPGESLEVATFGADGTFEFVEPSHVFATDAADLIEVGTRDGSTLRVTPEHKLLVAAEDGLSWRAAEAVEAGDRIARPLSVPTPDSGELNWVERMHGERTHVTIEPSFAREHRLDRTVPLGSLRDVVSSPEAIRDATQQLTYVNASGNRSRPITPPAEVTPSLAAFVGLVVAEARLDGGRVKFYNTDERLRETVAEALVDLFGLDPVTGVQQSVGYVEVNSRTLTHYLESVFDVFASATGASAAVGSALVGADDQSRAAFLRAMFDAEAHVADTGHLELVQRNADHVTLVSYLLASFGVPSRRATVERAATNGSGTFREYETLYVSGADHLRRFADQIGFGIDRKAERLADHAGKTANPNHDTVPRQAIAREVCADLNLPVGGLLRDTLDPERPGRVAHLGELRAVVEAANDRLEAAQEVVETLDALEPRLAETTSLPARWVAVRDTLEPLDTRKAVSADHGVRTDRLLEYADGRRTPEATRAGPLLADLDERTDDAPPTEAVRETLATCIDALGVSYATVADGTRFHSSELSTLLGNDDHDVRSLSSFGTVAERLQTLADEMLSLGVVERLRALDRLAAGTLYFDEVASVGRDETGGRVYDLTVPQTRNYVAGAVPTVMHNTTSATAIAREVYGEDWRGNFLELNASDERGIDVVRDRIKNFARTSFGGYDHRIVFLDEADSLCLPPGTGVVTGNPSAPEVRPIETVADDGEPMPSVDLETNEITPDTGRLVDSGVADFFELTLTDGRQVPASLTHPFFVVGDDGRLVERELRDLAPGDEIADFADEAGVSRCGVCGDWTGGRLCSPECENERRGREPCGTARSDERRETVPALSGGRSAGENSPNHGDDFRGARVRDTDADDAERDGPQSGEMRSGTPSAETTVDPAVADGGCRPVSTVEVDSIEHSHRGKAYNVSMADTPNFVLANGILTHNTSDAQSALRRTMEQFSDNTRFILSCNYSSKIIDPIQSRCAVFRFSPLADEAVAAQVDEIAAAEGIDLTDDGREALVYAAAGDMRRAINALQAAATTGETVDEETVFTVTSTARPEDIEAMVRSAVDGDFAAARAELDRLLTDVGMAGGDVIDQLHRSAWSLDLPDRATVRLLERMGEADYRITEGASEQVQLEAMLAALALD
ncbi:MAG: DNA polymerase III, delta subunit [uncultured archaeon A07HB70]|nr:MAG: DNA polymerase III, delta subunit [uncultured archaeon A07HB70]